MTEHLAIESVISGNTPGRVYTDALDTPRNAVLWTLQDAVYIALNDTDDMYIKVTTRRNLAWRQPGNIEERAMGGLWLQRA